MKTCTFFGHRDCPESVKEDLYAAIKKLIRQGVDTFYVGDNGQFDRYVRSVPKAMQAKHPQIDYAVVLSHLPTDRQTAPTLFPEGVETVPPRFAIEYRNRWLLHQADWVICYVACPYGGAYKFARIAKQAGKLLVNLSDKDIL